MKLQSGQWVFWYLDEPLSGGKSVFEGPFTARRKVGELTHMQVLAYWRHSRTRGLYYGFKTKSGNWMDVRLIGDVEAAFGDDQHVITDE